MQCPIKCEQKMNIGFDVEYLHVTYYYLQYSVLQMYMLSQLQHHVLCKAQVLR